MTAPPAMMTVNSPLMDRHSCVWLNEMLILFLQDGAHWQNKRLNSKLQLLMTRSGSQKLVNENIFVSLSSFTASSGDERVGDEGVKKGGIVVSSGCSAHPMSASVQLSSSERFFFVSISSIGPVSCFHITSLLSIVGTIY